MIRCDYSRDLIVFEGLIKNQHFIDEQNVDKFNDLYCLCYYIYNILPESNNKDKSLLALEKTLRRDLVCMLSSLYTLNFESAQRDIRTSIESVIRLVGYSLKSYIYEERKRHNYYNSSCQLKDLKGIENSTKIGRVMNKVYDIYEDTYLKKAFSNLKDGYSFLSEISHFDNKIANKKDLSENIKELKNRSIDETNNILDSFIDLVQNILVLIYYVSLLYNQDNLSQQDYIYMTKILKHNFSEEFLEILSKNYRTIVPINYEM